VPHVSFCFRPERAVHNERTRRRRLPGRTFGEAEIDEILRELGMIQAERERAASVPPTRESVITLCGEGCSNHEIARRTGLSPRAVGRILTRHGVHRQQPEPASSKRDQILRLRDEGCTLEEIGRAVGHSAKAVARALRRRP
jgi:DNA-binding NarL/FixJ family response regulator